MGLSVMLASSHKVSQHIVRAHHSPSTIHDLGGILHHCHAAKMVDPDFSVKAVLKHLGETAIHTDQ